MFVDDFFMQYETLKASENWPSIVELGRAALDEGLDPQNNAFINVRLSSSLFYLGKKHEALDAAVYAFGNATIIENKELEARSLYLLSATHRSLGSKEESFSYIYSSLNYVDNPEVSQITKLKIFFNGGALYQDLDHNSIKAKNYYAQALEICKDIDEEDDCNRTAIRSIRATLELGEFATAAQEADMIAAKINLNSKTAVHYLQLKSKISFALDNYQDSYTYASQGLEIATSKQMQTEIKMLNELIEKISSNASLRT